MLTLGGVARCDSPGCCAKSYTLMDLENEKSVGFPISSGINIVKFSQVILLHYNVCSLPLMKLSVCTFYEIMSICKQISL